MKSNTKYLQIAAYVLLVCILVIAIGVFRDCQRVHIEAPEGFSKGDTLDVALIYGPGGYYIYGDTLAGINIEIARNYSDSTGIPVKIWPISQPSVGMEKLQSGAFDIIASLPLDNYIKSNFGVSESIFLDRLVLIQLTDSTGSEQLVKSSLDLDGREVTVAKGSSAIQRLQNLSEEIGGNITITESPDLSDELITLQVALGSIPLAVVNERVAKTLAKDYPNLTYDNSVSFTQFQVWVFNKEDSVGEQGFNRWFDKFRDTETYRSILKKY